MMFQTPPMPPCLLRLLINHLWRSNCKSGVPQGWKLGMSNWGSQGGIGTGATARASRNAGPRGRAPLPRENREALPQVCWSPKNSWDHSPSVGQKYRSVEDTQQWCLTGPHGNHQLCGDVYGGKIWLDGAPLLETWKHAPPSSPSPRENQEVCGKWGTRSTISPLKHWSHSAPTLRPLPKVCELLRISKLPCFIFHGTLHSWTSHWRANSQRWDRNTLSLTLLFKIRFIFASGFHKGFNLQDWWDNLFRSYVNPSSAVSPLHIRPTKKSR